MTYLFISGGVRDTVQSCLDLIKLMTFILLVLSMLKDSEDWLTFEKNSLLKFFIFESYLSTSVVDRSSSKCFLPAKLYLEGDDILAGSMVILLTYPFFILCLLSFFEMMVRGGRAGIGYCRVTEAHSGWWSEIKDGGSTVVLTIIWSENKILSAENFYLSVFSKVETVNSVALPAM